jgi:zinc and cadmium transporter
MTLYAFVAAIIIMTASLSGIIFNSNRLGGWIEKKLGLLITFSLGVLGIITLDLIRESFEHSEVLVVLLAMVGGMLFLKIFSFIIPDAHHHHDINTGHSHSKIDARHILLGDAVHNITDGFLLVPAFLVSTQVGIATTLGILLHELVQEISEFFILKQAGYSTKEALIKNFLVSSTILLGVGLSLVLSSVETFEAPLIAFASGGFLYIIFRDLVPNTIETIKKNGKPHLHIGAVLLGIVIMISIKTFVPHEQIKEVTANEIFSAIELVQ